MENKYIINEYRNESSIPVYAVSIYVAFLPIVSLLWNRIANIAFVVVCLIVIFSKGFTLEFNEKLIKWLGSMILWAFFVTLFAVDKSLALSDNFIMLRCSVLSWLIVTVCDTKKRLWTVLIGFVIGTLLMIGLVLYTVGWDGIIGQMRNGARVGGEVTNENTIGQSCAITVVISFCLVFIMNKKWAWCLLLPSAFMIFASASRMAMLMSVIGILTVCILQKKGNMFLGAIIGIIGLIIMYFILRQIPLFHTVFSRMDESLAFLHGENEADDTTIMRIDLIKFGFQRFFESPLVGYGAGNFNRLYAMYVRNASPHNTYIEALVSFGLLGFIIWYGMYFSFIKRMIKERSEPLFCLVAAIILTWMTGDFFGHTILTKTSYMLIGIGFSAIKLTDAPIEN